MKNQDVHQLTREGYRIALGITKRYAKTFYFASLFLASDMRRASYAVYAVCRISDDAVDTKTELQPEEALQNIEDTIRTAYAHTETNNPLIFSFRETVERYKIPQAYFNELLTGMRMDLTKHRYKDFAELYGYCYKVAGIIGLIMLRIFGSSDQKIEKHAIDLGIAMQLTNIIRDVKEDLERNRIYIPQQEFEKFGVVEQDIKNGILNTRLRSLIAFQISRARSYYKNAQDSIALIPTKRARFVVQVMKTLYAQILTEAENNRYEIFKKRVYVPLWKKISISLQVLLQGALP